MIDFIKAQESKGHSHSPCPQKNVHNFSLEWPTIFLPAPFSYNFNPLHRY